jgi:hypothetical protein
MNGDQNNGGENGRGFHIRKEPLREGITDEEMVGLCELRKIAGAVECRREGEFLVTKWPLF